jgi:hypothetical protein
VCITATTTTSPAANADTYTIDVDGNFSINSLTLGGTSGAQTLFIISSFTLSLSANSAINATGTVMLGGSGSAPATLGGGATLTNAGLIETSTCQACGAVLGVNTVNGPSGVIDAIVSLHSGGVSNNGTVKLECNLQNVGILALDGGATFTQSPGGVVVEHVDVTSQCSGRLQSGSVSQNGNALLDGTLKVITSDGSPAAGSSWPVITNTNVSGQFASYQFGGVNYNPQYSATGLILVVGPGTGLPESPLTVMLPFAGLATGLSGFAVVRRIRRPLRQT